MIDSLFTQQADVGWWYWWCCKFKRLM